MSFTPSAGHDPPLPRRATWNGGWRSGAERSGHRAPDGIRVHGLQPTETLITKAHVYTTMTACVHDCGALPCQTRSKLAR